MSQQQQNLFFINLERGFLRIKLGEALEKRGVAPHIFESAGEAQSDWRQIEGVGVLAGSGRATRQAQK